MATDPGADQGQQVGFEPPPPGVTANLDDPVDAGHTLNLVGLSICCAFIIVFFSIRAYARLFVIRRVMLSDISCLVGSLLSLVYAGTCYAMTYYGLGYHAWEVSPENYSQVLKWLYASSVVYIPAAYAVKLTILLLIARVFAVHERVARGVYIFCFVLLLAYTPIQTIKVMICVPVAAYWDPSLPRSGCINQRKVFISDLVLAVVADLVIITVPLPVTLSLRLPLRKKLKIILMLCAGGVATGVTIFRLVRVIQFVGSTDLTADFVALDLTTLIELTIGVVCSCLPSVHFLWERQKTRCRARRPGYKNPLNRPRTGRFDRPAGYTTTTSKGGGGGGSSWLTTTTRKTMRALHITAVHKDSDEGVEQSHAAVAEGAAPGQEMSETTTNDNGDMAPPARAYCRHGSLSGTCCEEARRAQGIFDLELARFTGAAAPPRRTGCGGGRGREDESYAGILAASVVNSADGWREGWLAPQAAGDVETAAPGLQQPMRLWDAIWDGTPEDIPR